MPSVQEETKTGEHVTTISFESTDKSGSPVELLIKNYSKLLAENEALKAEINELRQNPAQSPLDGILTKINHYSRIVNDAEVAKDFYVNVLGCTLLNRPKNLTNPGYWLWMGNIQLHLIEHLHDEPESLVGSQGFVNHLSFETDDIKQAEIRLKENNIPYVRNVIPEGKYLVEQLFFPDPDGYYCEICTCAQVTDFVFGEPQSKEDNPFAIQDDALLIQLQKAYNLAVSGSSSIKSSRRKDLAAFIGKTGQPVDEHLLAGKTEELKISVHEESKEMS